MCATSIELQLVLYILQDLKTPHNQPARVYIDNRSTYCISHNLVLHEKSKHLSIDLHFTREKIQRVIKLFQIPTSKNIDALTKPLSQTHLRLWRGKWDFWHVLPLWGRINIYQLILLCGRSNISSIKYSFTLIINRSLSFPFPHSFSLFCS